MKNLSFLIPQKNDTSIRVYDIFPNLTLFYDIQFTASFNESINEFILTLDAAAKQTQANSSTTNNGISTIWIILSILLPILLFIGFAIITHKYKSKILKKYPKLQCWLYCERRKTYRINPIDHIANPPRIVLETEETSQISHT